MSFRVILLVSLLACSVGFHMYICFFSVGYGLSIAVSGLSKSTEPGNEAEQGHAGYRKGIALYRLRPALCPDDEPCLFSSAQWL